MYAPSPMAASIAMPTHSSGLMLSMTPFQHTITHAMPGMAGRPTMYAMPGTAGWHPMIPPPSWTAGGVPVPMAPSPWHMAPMVRPAQYCCSPAPPRAGRAASPDAGGQRTVRGSRKVESVVNVSTCPKRQAKQTAFDKGHAKVEPETWLGHLQTATVTVFKRVELTDQADAGPGRRDAVLNAILAGINNDRRPDIDPTTAAGKGMDTGAATRGQPCWIVKLADGRKKTHFQVPVDGCRRLAQKIALACCKPKKEVLIFMQSFFLSLPLPHT